MRSNPPADPRVHLRLGTDGDKAGKPASIPWRKPCSADEHNWPCRWRAVPGGSFLIDYATGIYAALGAMYALYHRNTTGLGQRVRHLPSGFRNLAYGRRRAGGGAARATSQAHG